MDRKQNRGQKQDGFREQLTYVEIFPSSLASCLQASCLSSSGRWSYKVGSSPSFQIPNKEGDSTSGSKYASHYQRPPATGILDVNILMTIRVHSLKNLPV